MAGPPPAPNGTAGAPDQEDDDLHPQLEQTRREVARLRETESMYRHAAELGRWLIWSADPEGRFLDIGSTFNSITGIEDERTLKGGWIEAVHPEDREALLRKWHHSLETGEQLEAEFRGLLSDGSIRIMRSRAKPLRDEKGAITRWFGSTEDIDDQRCAEARLRESEELHRFTLELTRQIVWSIEPDGSDLKLSPRYYEVTGTEPGDDPSQSVHPDDLDRVQAIAAAGMAQGTTYSTECRLRMVDGSYRFFRIRSTPLRDAQGRIVRWYGISEDIHDERHAEQKRREVEERYRLAINATNDAVWDYDVEADHLEWSDNTADLFGSIGPGGSRLEWWVERLHPEDRERVLAGFEAAIAGGDTRWSEEYRFRRSDGSYADILDHGFIIRDEAGKPRRAVGAMADVTARKRAEAEIRRMQAELIHVSRLSAMGTMASTLAHELNQPLAALSNFISGARRLAMAGPGKQDDLLAALEAAAAGAARAGEIVRRLRDLVGRGTVSLQIEHLPGLVEEAMVVATAAGNAGTIRHSVELERDAHWVRADRVPIQQVLINLIRNSVEAIGGGDRREIRVTARASGEMVEVAIADTGTGIPPDQFDTIFSRFVTTKSSGMGIGLAISRTIIELHGGKIWAENRPEGGAVFRFTLPRAERRKTTPATKKE